MRAVLSFLDKDDPLLASRIPKEPSWGKLSLADLPLPLLTALKLPESPHPLHLVHRVLQWFSLSEQRQYLLRLPHWLRIEAKQLFRQLHLGRYGFLCRYSTREDMTGATGVRPMIAKP